MSNFLHIKHTSDYEAFHGQESLHPLTSVIEYKDISPVRPSINRYEVYGLFLHSTLTAKLRYGAGRYDYKDGVLICMAPGQVGGAEGDEPVEVDGWSLLFHPDLMHGTSLEKTITDYTFFDYRINEALHLTEEEQHILETIIRSIKEELRYKHDGLQNKIIVSLVEALLNYCQRFYNRQFLTRRQETADILVRIEQIVRLYYADRDHKQQGLPSVRYCADQLNMSANYLGDVVKKTTGENISKYIRRFVIQQAKSGLVAGKTVSEVAYDLGFEYPQHLTRLFKKETGITPSEFIINGGGY